MAPSNSDFITRADRVLLYGMGVGTLLMLQPFWDGGLKWGFFVTLVSTVLEIVTGHMLPDAIAKSPASGASAGAPTAGDA